MTTTFLEKAYKLKINPFDIVDVTARMGGRRKEKDKWTKIIERRVGQNKNSINFIIGDYGMGKSFTLYKIYKQYEKDPRFLPITTKLLPEDSVSKFGLDFIQRILRPIDFKKLVTKNCKQNIEDLKEFLPDQYTIFKRIAEGSTLAEIFLKGERGLSTKEFEKLKIKRKLESTEVARDYLLATLSILKKNTPTVLLTVDEVEYIFSQLKGARLSMVFNTMRDLFDLPQSPKALRLKGGVANMIYFLGISQSGWNNFEQLEKRESKKGGPIQPFMRRVEGKILLSPLSKTEVTELIELRLQYNRTQSRYKKEPLIPYTKKFVNYIAELSLGNPGEVVKRCDVVLEEGLREKIRLLTKNFAEKVFKSYYTG